MLYQDFCIQIKENVEILIGSTYMVEILEVEKINGLLLKGLIMKKDLDIVSPTIYLEDYFQKYQRGSTIQSLAKDICNLYESISLEDTFKSQTPTLELNQIKDRIYYRLINYDMNKSYLEKVPHIKMMDLAIIFSVLVTEHQSELGSFTITNQLINLWNVDWQIIYNLAIQNTPVLFPSKVTSMYDVLCNLLNDDINEPDIINSIISDDTSPMYVATNTSGIHGASWMLYESELQKVSDKFHSSLYILPSSIHEVILLPISKELSKHELLHMVQDINTTQVPQDEILSNNIYYYDRSTNELSQLF